MSKIAKLSSIFPDVEKLDSSKIKNVIDSIDDLPAMPSTFMRIREAIDNPKCCSRDLADIIEIDQSLTSKILRIANSAYYGFPRTISTVNDAIVLMGYQKTWHLSMSVSMMNIFSKDSKIFNMEVFWEHSLKVGLCAQIIARVFSYPKPQELYTVGLLHDIGKLILDQYFHADFLTSIRLAKEKSISFVEAENEIIGVSHPVVGAWIVDRWNFPEFMIEGIALHHGKFTSSVSRVAHIIGFADTICLMKGIGFNFDKGLIKKCRSLSAKLNFTTKHIENVENQFNDAAARITIKADKQKKKV